MTRAIIIATGPSLMAEDIHTAICSDRQIYAVNNAYTYLMRADVLYACDCEWWNLHHKLSLNYFINERWTTNDEAAKKYGLNHVPGEHWEQRRIPFDVSGHGIVYGGNSGFQALNLAYIKGIRDAILLGFDMGHEKNESKHCHGEHPSGIDRPSPFAEWIRSFERAAPVIAAAGMQVRNATRRTRLTCFPQVDLREAVGG